MTKSFLENSQFKKILKKEFKNFNWTELLLLLALILMYFQSRYMMSVYKDPCSYCYVQQPNLERMTCKEYFNPIIDKFPFDNYNFENMTLNLTENGQPINLFNSMY